MDKKLKILTDEEAKLITGRMSGQNAISGDGPDTWKCGKCDAELAKGMGGILIVNKNVYECWKCGALNETP